MNLTISVSGGGGLFRFLISYILCFKHVDNTVTNEPLKITITDIRSDRPKPGMHEQIVKTLESLINTGYIKCNPEPKIGLTKITIERTAKYDELDVVVVTRGSTLLVAQNFIVPLVLLGGKVLIKGVFGGISSPPNLESTLKVLETCDLLKFLNFTLTKNGLLITRTDVDITSFTGIELKNSWTPYKNIPNSKEFKGNVDNKTFIFVGETHHDEILIWMKRVCDKFGYCPFVYDQLLMFAAILGGNILVPHELMELKTDGKLYDSHTFNLIKLFTLFSDVFKPKITETETGKHIQFDQIAF